MRSTWARITTVSVAAVAATACAAIGAGAAAGTAQPIVLGSCATTVQGAPGTPVELSPAAALQPVDSVLAAIPFGLGNVVASAVNSALDDIPAIPLGALPTGTGTITGGQIANAIVTQLDAAKIPALGTVVGTLQSGLAKLCGVTVDGVNAVAAPVQQGTASVSHAAQKAEQQVGLAPKSGSAPGGGTPGKTGSSGGGGAPPAQQGGSGTGGLPSSDSPVVGGLPADLGGGDTFGAGALLDFGIGESPLARYAGIPFASAGLFDPAPGVQYGSDVPGYQPNSGGLGQQGSSDGVQTAGQAFAYDPGGSLGDGVGLPMLLAVLMLAGVTAALVRTWVLRRVRTA